MCSAFPSLHFQRSKAAAAAVAAAAGRAASEAAGRAAAEATASAAATAAAPASATTTKRGSKWGLASNLPFIGQPMKMASAPAATAAAAAAATAAGAAASAAAAVAAAAAAAAKTAAAKTGPTTGRVGFSADPTASSARTGQAAMLLNAQVQAQAQADKEAQQRAEAIARVQVGHVGLCSGEVHALFGSIPCLDCSSSRANAVVSKSCSLVEEAAIVCECSLLRRRVLDATALAFFKQQSTSNVRDTEQLKSASYRTTVQPQRQYVNLSLLFGVQGCDCRLRKTVLS